MAGCFLPVLWGGGVFRAGFLQAALQLGLSGRGFSGRFAFSGYYIFRFQGFAFDSIPGGGGGQQGQTKGDEKNEQRV